MYKRLLFFIIIFCQLLTAKAQQVTIAGRVADEETQKPIEFASILMKENGLWAITGADGSFRIKNIPTGKVVLTIQCLGYATRQIALDINKDIPRLRINLKQENLKLDEVTVTAKRKDNESTTSYTIDRAALDQQQLLNVSDIATLLPGGKTVNATLMSDNRMALRSGSQEKGNASFGTAIEVDGMRLDNNAAAGETAGASTRTISASNIESIEVVTGIPSVEYGDLSNGVVKVNTRKGKSPFIVEGKLNQHTQQIALNKGFDLGRHDGVLNISFEHARSFSNAASPHTAYQRNILSLHYMNIFMRETTPLTLNMGLTGNIGGYNAEADPDNELDDYSKSRDNNLRAHFELNWLLNKKWITNLSLRGSLSTADRKSEDYTHTNSATTLANLHALEEGYFMDEEGEMPSERITPDRIDYLAPNEIFVFGSNKEGHHNGGAARAALMRFGANYGQGMGIQGQSYAIPTTGSIHLMKRAIYEFLEYARQHPDKRFLVTAIGCGNAGYEPGFVACLFHDAVDVQNICLPRIFCKIVVFICIKILIRFRVIDIIFSTKALTRLKIPSCTITVHCTAGR